MHLDGFTCSESLPKRTRHFEPPEHVPRTSARAQTCDIHGFTCTLMALRARNPSPSGLATLNPQSMYHGPQPGPKLACGVRAGSLRATEPWARGKIRGRKKKKCRWAKKTHLYIYIQRSSSGCVRSKIPGVTQGDEKRYEGNTAVVTAYMCWRKPGIYLSRGINSD